MCVMVGPSYNTLDLISTTNLTLVDNISISSGLFCMLPFLTVPEMELDLNVSILAYDT